MLAGREVPARLAVLGDPTLLAERVRTLAAAGNVEVVVRADPAAVLAHRPGALQVLPVPLAAPSVPGRLDPRNAAYVLEMLKRGTADCLSGAAAALVTAPVQKSVIVQSGVPFTGHTELLAELTGAPLPVMMLASRTLRVVVATTHLPLRAVPAALTAAGLEELITIVHRDLVRRFGLDSPRLLVLGLNPHAGEHGTLGDEDDRVIAPVVRELAAAGMRITGPVAGDTAFTPASLSRCDVVIAMYHDQGLAPLKALSFGEVVNVTLGLPIVRTSVDHGTALDLAGTGAARPDSLFAAVDLAIELARRACAEAP